MIQPPHLVTPRKKNSHDSAAGRRRDSSKHKAILQATREILEENGYQGLSIKKIASRANVSRNVLYNWWDGEINRLVEEALLPNIHDWALQDTGSFKGDIEMFLDLSIDALKKPNILKGFLILAAEVANNKEELIETTRYFRAPYAKLVGKIIRRAEERDEICQGLNAQHLAQIISGSLMQFAISKNPGRRKTKMILSEIIQKLAAK